ncbi:MAG: glucose-6-phosphate isomerase [Bacteroidales bacterium]
MENLKIKIDKVFGFVGKEEIFSLRANALASLSSLYEKSGKGNDFLGWVNLPSQISGAEMNDIENTARVIRTRIDLVVVIGIGGSYLGTRAVSEALAHSFEFLKEKNNNPQIIYAGHNLGEDYLTELLEILDHKRYAIVVISKSGTTTEPAIAFRILKQHLEEKVGRDEARNFIIAVTDEKKGALRKMADDEGYKSYIIPDDIGGRYSVLTPVGLVPLAIAGFDIRSLVKGAKDMQALTSPGVKFEVNPAALYAATRYLLYRKGKKVEILANFENKLHYLAEWWKQLYGESEGKEGKGIFPASIDLTSDLHSMGQYIQEGERILMETVISVKSPKNRLEIPGDKDNLDGLNFLAGKRIDEVNKMAELGTMFAHIDGGVPNIQVLIPVLNEYYIGQLMYFFEIACGISGYLLDVNPFNQPGVEAYKKNMFALLDKPGFESDSAIIKKRLEQ